MSVPWKFQSIDADRAAKDFKFRCILGHEPGLGKTYISLLACLRHVKGRILVICPAGLKEHWSREAETHLGWHGQILSGLTPDIFKPEQFGKFVIINYDILRLPSKNIVTWTQVLQTIPFSCVIIDEGHNIKEESSQRSRAVMLIRKNIPKRLALTGTAIVNRPIEIFKLIRFCRPNLFPSKFDFGLRYCALKRKNGDWDYSGHSHLDELHKIITRECFIRRRKVDVIKDLPKKIRSIVPFELEKTAIKEYRHAESDFTGWLAGRDYAAAMRSKHAELIVKTGYLKRLSAELKYRWVEAWIADFLEENDEKLIVFGVHKRILHPLHDRFAKESVLVDGGVTGSSRQALFDQFNTDKSKRLFIGNIIAAGVGWSCKSASNVAFIELDWVPGNHLQAEDRCHGIGRGTGAPVNIYYLVAKETLEIDLCEILEKKQRVIQQTLDGKKVPDLNVMQLVIERMLRRNK